MIQLPSSQGWILTFLSSLMCIFGSFIIFSDDIVRIFNKNSRFNLKSNEKFLIFGFSFSSGSLLFTSLYKLLPKSFGYFKEVDKNLPNTFVLIYFIIGLIICGVLNKIIHYFTSESIVHCSHDGHDGHDGHNGHSNGYDNDAHNNFHSHDSHNHSHSHINENSSSSTGSDIEPHSHSKYDEESMIETSPLVSNEITSSTNPYESIKRKKSTLEIVIDKFSSHNKPCTGIDDECNGESSVCIIPEQLRQKLPYDIQNLEAYRYLKLNAPDGSLVAYTSEDDKNPVILNQVTLPAVSNVTIKNEPDLNLHSSHKDDHHHQITTPISKLFSIGLQTCLALTLHKLPEGFITYATSKADPKLGITIFVSLALHNIVEGFTMALPLYLALNSKFKAFLITFFLGGLSQPIGALVAHLILRDEKLDEQQSSYIFGILIAITSGFLTIISLQLFTSSIGFGGSPNVVIIWCLLGMIIILSSGSLIELGSF
ncbi:hypothetical protein WICMUC_004923 [Wickerhamomyces mucosus]|uniref:Zinc/iron permease n=1 Tax=Wickerhamomyces mucosus TaxID=1378264 RepID=A0A9P8PEV3_9ASCO|nr:hypothetical protein WICMUC_004923 [Wickerhamomyces mucosus]